MKRLCSDLIKHYKTTSMFPSETLHVFLQKRTENRFLYTTVVKTSKTGGYFLQQRNIKSNRKNNTGKLSKFIQTAKTNNPTGKNGTTSLLPIGDASLFIETRGNTGGDENVFINFERTVNIQIKNISFY